MKKVVSVFIALLLVLVAVPSTAYASSQYDGAVEVTPKIVLKTWGATPVERNFTYNWREVAKQLCTDAPMDFLNDGDYVAVTVFDQLYYTVYGHLRLSLHL